MCAAYSQEVTELLQAWSQGEESALQKLVPLVYSELHRLAHGYMNRERSDHTLQTTALLNEAYLRLVDSTKVNWQNRAHFMGVCARAMRSILVDWARSRHSLKRGGDAVPLQLEETLVALREPGVDIVAVDEALQALEAVDARKARIVELRFFGGLSVEETAEVLKISVGTVMRDWKLAKDWLRRELDSRNSGSDANPGGSGRKQ
jgi:RNA polymerase sigma factor (TIGR02999 family)